MKMSLVRANWPLGFQVEVKVLSSIKEYQPGPQIPPSIWLTIGLSSRAIRLHDLVLENDVATAAEWMSTSVRGLGSRRPLDMVRTSVETKAVCDLIGRLEQGVIV
jgi:hypothetical protein